MSSRPQEAERLAPGASADAVLWENVGAKIADQGFVSWGLVALFSLAGVIASVGILIDSAPIVVGAMAVSPDFGPIAAFSVGVVRRRRDYVVGGFGAVTIGFTAAIVFALLSTVFLRCVGVAPDEFRRIGNSMAQAIAAPDGFSVVVALCAGAAGMLSVTLGKSAALVGVAISITTIPAAADIGLSLAYGDRVSFRGSALQLALNIISLLVAATLTLMIQRTIYVRRRRRHRLGMGLAPLREPLGRFGYTSEEPSPAVAPADAVTPPTPATPTPRSSSEPDDDLAREAARRGMASQVGRAHARGARLQHGLVDRPRRPLELGAVRRGVLQDRGARQDHRHRVREVLALQRRRGAVRRLGHGDGRAQSSSKASRTDSAPAIEPNIGITRSLRQSPSRLSAGTTSGTSAER